MMNIIWFVASAEPTAPTTNSAPITKSIFLRPYLSAGIPAVRAPRMVPMSAVATVNPRPAGLRLNSWASATVVPEITAVSKPKIRPPSEATIALRMTRGRM